MKQSFKISLNVHPVVAKWMDCHLEKVGDAYVISKSKYYSIIVGSLTRKNIKLQSRIPEKYEKFEKVFCYISDFDFYHFGFYISDFMQYKISKAIYDDIVDKMLYSTMVLFCCSGLARDRIMRQQLIEFMFEDDEMTIENFRKLYQRKYLDQEKEFKAFIKECNVEY